MTLETESADEMTAGSGAGSSNWRGFVVRTAVWVAAITWCVGTLLSVSVQDSIPILSGIFYALPMPILIVAGGIVCAAILHRAYDCRIIAACLLLLEMQVVIWGGQAFHVSTDEPPANAYRFVFWNVCRGTFGYDATASQLADFDADVIALVEATEEAEYPEFWTSRIPGYSAKRLGSGMMILCRGEILGVTPGNVTVAEEPEAVCRYRIISLKVDGSLMRVLLMDVKSDPLMFRRPAFVRLAELAEELADQPLIVAADFNTPINSVWVDQLRRRLTNSFEAAGDGYRETWPTLLPVLCLDQVWGNDRVLWHRSRHGWSIRSDHRSVTSEFSIVP
ncbi:MAG: endonuclease/exonuclease/phosphatase family protein [Rhodopirellula sp.]|nr:endonuclease/exonuclease/phosphatase family protein [Rhodopirellula sp.]